MKNATKYQMMIRKLLSGLDNKPAAPPSVVEDALTLVVEAVVSADVSDKQAEKAMEALRQEFVDINELRVSPPKEIAEVLGKDCPGGREKAVELVSVLNATFDRHNALSLRDLNKLPKREIRRRLLELGLSPFATAWLLLRAFGAHGVPVDRTLVDCLEIAGCVEPGSSIAAAQSLLERTIRQKDAPAAYAFFRDFVARSAKALTRKRKADAEAEARAQAKAAREALAASGGGDGAPPARTRKATAADAPAPAPSRAKAKPPAKAAARPQRRTKKAK